jgi:cytochrome c biogenesis protein CcmG/thiol:disulfide interchange protein DsbE
MRATPRILLTAAGLAGLAMLGMTPRARAQALPGSGFVQAKPWLGVAIGAGDKGVLVNDVLEGAPAKAAGLLPGDQITAIDDIAVKAPDELIKAVQAQGVGNTVVVHFLRGAKTDTRRVKLVARPDELALLQSRLVGKPAPAFDLKVVRGGGPGSSAALKGKVAVVEFWATWCPACRSTHARLSGWAKEHRKDVTVVAISDEEEADVKAYADLVKPNFTIRIDPTHKTPGDWMVSAIPQIAVVDRKGIVTFATVGAGEYVEEALAAAEKAAGAR